MSADYLARCFEFNNWANEQILHLCGGLSDAQLDAAPESATSGTIRETLVHLAAAQQGYLRNLTLPVEQRRDRVSLGYTDVAQSLRSSGEALLALVSDPARVPQEMVALRDGGRVEPWVIVVQILDHGAEHREQVKSMLSALGVEVPELDGWAYGEAAGAAEFDA